MVWFFIGVYRRNRTLHGRLEIRIFSSRVEKIFYSFAALTCEIFSNTPREISYNILYLFYYRLYIIDTHSCFNYFIIWFVAILQTAKSVEIMYVTCFHSYQALSPLSVCWLLCCSKRRKQIAREMVSECTFRKIK